MPEEVSTIMRWWREYWFAPSPYLDLAVVRIVAVAVWLWWISRYLPHLAILVEQPDSLYEPLPILNILNLPFGWGFRPGFAVIEIMYYIAMISGFLSLIGLFANASLVVFAFCSVYLQAFMYSFGDYHHVDEVMLVALSVLALSPSGRVLSIDWLRRQARHEGFDTVVGLKSEYAGWSIKLIQWFFVLMYLSAVAMKLSASGHEWANGYTLQYYLILDGLRHDSQLALWFAQHHTLIYILQIVTLLFQVTFVLPVLFPRLRWIYVPLGLSFHVGILLTLNAPFLTWIGLYTVFIPWSQAVRDGLRYLRRKRAAAGHDLTIAR
jgi:hypothetical protein